jgi:CHASE2 domain-containing sensor protein
VPRAEAPVESPLSRRRAVLVHLAHGLFAGLLVALVYLSGVTLGLDKRAYDLWFQLSPVSDRPAQHTVVVAIDDSSLARLGGWRWSSRQLADLLRAVNRAKPAAVGVDILLDEPRDDSDVELAAALAETRRVVVAASLHGLRDPAASSRTDGPASRLGADAVGFANAVEDRPDGYVRSWQLAVQDGRTTLLSFPVRLARAASGRRAPEVRVAGDRVWLPASGKAGSEWPLVHSDKSHIV